MMTCDFCGETIKTETQTGMNLPIGDVGEFWNPELGDSQVGHADCAAEAGLEMA